MCPHLIVVLSYAAANVGFVTLKLPARGAVAFVCSCQVICQFCQRDVKNASAEALNTCADFLPGGGCALPGLQDPLTGSHPVGPRKRSAAGQDVRHGTRDVAGWRLRLTRPTGSTHRLTPRRPAQAQRRRARYQAR
ncbi:hypothetical protein EXU14_18020 [Klebsiella quasipneumoniae subsp. similipneumoniae]|nr:hypothetical protein B6I49_05810 [Klebsiella quasipneumoniae]TBO83865.1 hypothetical protein EXT88_18060 [Klebsiella quasipneumoniae subsp. similipneumoniae]PLI86099.1 hypothetical protein B6J54_14710 [Klebsiella quasipneumoniae]TBO99464.1 hypothetical protein EXU20_19785 [Klebsiella quasipneumoniae subsp. similipneumoniae]TBP06744.1 hypothetical protein EXU16_13925 [Klebsiella quasipneumoniae subsp. similipneumoniae]